MYSASGATRVKVSFSYAWLNARLSPSYLHINGFIHRDVKAANLLVDDDGTVLLGDIGVAADLTEDRAVLPPPGIRSISQLGHTRHSSSTDNGSTRRVVLVEPVTSSPSAPTRPKMGKRKSFVGTVSTALLLLGFCS